MKACHSLGSFSREVTALLKTFSWRLCASMYYRYCLFMQCLHCSSQVFCHVRGRPWQEYVTSATMYALLCETLLDTPPKTSPSVKFTPRNPYHPNHYLRSLSRSLTPVQNTAPLQTLNNLVCGWSHKKGIRSTC